MRHVIIEDGEVRMHAQSDHAESNAPNASGEDDIWKLLVRSMFAEHSRRIDALETEARHRAEAAELEAKLEIERLRRYTARLEAANTALTERLIAATTRLYWGDAGATREADQAVIMPILEPARPAGA